MSLLKNKPVVLWKVVLWENAPREERLLRWQQVRRVLVELPLHERERHFDMKDWMFKTDCGTVACAAGHCGMDSWFNERGFTAQLVDDSEYSNGHRLSMPIAPSDFFGSLGARWIFLTTGYGLSHRSTVDEVIGAINLHLRWLQDNWERA